VNIRNISSEISVKKKGLLLIAFSLWLVLYHHIETCCWWFGLWCSNRFQQYFSYIVTVSFIGEGNRRKPPTSRKLLTNFITLCYIEYTSSSKVFELTTLVVIGTDCTGGPTTIRSRPPNCCWNNKIYYEVAKNIDAHR
jgi:hypothetical protein